MVNLFLMFAYKAHSRLTGSLKGSRVKSPDKSLKTIELLLYTSFVIQAKVDIFNNLIFNLFNNLFIFCIIRKQEGVYMPLHEGN